MEDQRERTSEGIMDQRILFLVRTVTPMPPGESHWNGKRRETPGEGSRNCCRANTLVVQRNQEALERQDLYDSMKRAMEKKLRENRQSYQDPFWKPLCKKEQEAVTKPKEIYPIKSP